MNGIPWWAQAICAGLVAAGPVAGTYPDLEHLWMVGWAFAIGFAAYVLGKYQSPPGEPAKKEKEKRWMFKEKPK